jgi:hypothetical protein
VILEEQISVGDDWPDGEVTGKEEGYSVESEKDYKTRPKFQKFQQSRVVKSWVYIQNG